jgi:hypothetical protein
MIAPREKARVGDSGREYHPRPGAAVPGGWKGTLHGHVVDSKPSSRMRRGIRYQSEAADVLEADGYLCHILKRLVHRRGNKFWSESADLWGIIDIAAMCARGERPPKFVQVTRPKENVRAHRREIERLPWWPGADVSVWERRLGGEHGTRPPGVAPGFRIHQYDPRAKTWTVTAFIPMAERKKHAEPK